MTNEGYGHSITGHIVAPFADISLTGGNYNGCIIAASVKTNSEGHMWSYHGKKLQPNPTPEPTATPEVTPVPSPTPEPTATPEVTPVPSATPEPTATPEVTPVPSTTPEPTATPEATPVPSATPKPAPVPSSAPAASAPSEKPIAPDTSSGSYIVTVRYTPNTADHSGIAENAMRLIGSLVIAGWAWKSLKR